MLLHIVRWAAALYLCLNALTGAIILSLWLRWCRNERRALAVAHRVNAEIRSDGADDDNRQHHLVRLP
jgi:hypothetical protein